MNLKPICILSLCLIFSCLVYSSPVEVSRAKRVATRWLAENSSPMESPISRQIQTVKTFRRQDGENLFFVISLDPAGFVILSPNDEIEPIVAFSTKGYFDDSQSNPLTALLERDMQARLKSLNTNIDSQTNTKSRSSRKRRKAHQKKWQTLTTSAPDSLDDEILIASDLATISDLRVAPLITTEWGQGEVLSQPCYNYYTPNNYVCGCVATSMAQLMRYHNWPVAGIGVHSFDITIDGVSTARNTLGGDGIGGAYDWSQMPDIPAYGITETQRQAIGALTHDAGCSVNMMYSSGSSGAYSYLSDLQFVDTFGYSNSIYSNGFSSSGDAQLWTMINSNLDAQLPVILSIQGSDGNHAVITDGYGYNDSTLYHHINMGWSSSDDAWYQLPIVDAAYNFDTINACIYNVFETASGEIISGRVTNSTGSALADVTITAYRDSTAQMQTTTNDRGIYAFKGVASYKQYRISANKSDYTFTDIYTTTGRSRDYFSTTGNNWGVDFSATNAQPPTVNSISVDVDLTQSQSVMIPLESVDDNLPNPPASITNIVTSLPAHGELAVPEVEIISSVPYTLPAGSNQLEYTPCPYFSGTDDFTYKANDGGTSPSGGDSETATVTINVNNFVYSEFGADSSSYSTFMMRTEEFYDLRSQMIYLQSEIGQAQLITDLAMKIYIMPGATLDNWTIRMQHTDWSEYPSDSTAASMFLAENWTTVYQADETITKTGWVSFHLDTPFDYNGADNLVIDISYNNEDLTTPSGGYFTHDTEVRRAISLVSETGTHGNPLYWTAYTIGSYYPDTRLPALQLTGQINVPAIPGDFDLNCYVSLPDMSTFAASWKSQQGQANYNDACDIAEPQNNLIDQADLAEFISHWLEIYP